MLYGIIDIGSNTIRMAIYLIEGDRIEFLMKQKHTVGLAAYVHDGVMAPEGIEKAIEVLQEFKSFLRNAVYGMPLPEQFTPRSELGLFKNLSQL